MIKIPGRLAVATRHGCYGPFNVGTLTTSIGEFVVKNAELDQYREGKYDGEFTIDKIRPAFYNTNGRMVIEVRALLTEITLFNVGQLSKDESHQLSPQEVDPAEEEAKAPAATPAIPTPEAAPIQASDETTSAGNVQTPISSDASAPVSEINADAELFATLWPLSEVVKLDATVDRRQLRKQRDRLDALGYEFRPLKQDWVLKAA